jgi:tetratricopeptide (TPR) repeat protein
MMARNKNNQVEKSLLSMGWARGLVYLALIFLAACGGGDTHEKVEKTDAGEIMRPKLAEGLKLAQEQKYDEAIAKVFEVVINNPKDAEALGTLSYIYFKSNRLPHAREMAKQALEIDPYQSKPLIVLARVHFDRSGFDEVLDLARKALTINPKAAEAYQIIGEVYLRQGLTQDALMVLKEAVKLDPENSETLNILGSAYIKLKQYDRALPLLLALLEIDPNNPGANFNLALVYAKMNDGQKAMRHITKAEYLYAQDKDDKHWQGKARDIRRVIAKDFKLRPEDINKRVSMN